MCLILNFIGNVIFWICGLILLRELFLFIRHIMLPKPQKYKIGNMRLFIIAYSIAYIISLYIKII